MEQIQNYQEEMIMGFATLVENKDELTKDYVNDLYFAAPMHDIGKIAIPDAILQKPGKLTQEEFEIMKQHAVKGGNIRETLLS